MFNISVSNVEATLVTVDDNSVIDMAVLLINEFVNKTIDFTNPNTIAVEKAIAAWFSKARPSVRLRTEEAMVTKFADMDTEKFYTAFDRFFK